MIWIVLFIPLILIAQENNNVTHSEESEVLFKSTIFIPKDAFTSGAEGPAVDKKGNLYAVNYEKQGTIGVVTPDGNARIFVELPPGSIGNGIRFNSKGDMFIADFSEHNILKVNMLNKDISVFAHDSTMNQPNDLAIADNDILYASDPNWQNSSGKLWRIDTQGKTYMLEDNMGTTNGVEVAPGNNLLYVNESIQRNVWVYDLSNDGAISNKRLLISFPDFGLDGMRCDIAGNIYITRYGEGTVVKVSPEGNVLQEIQLSGKNVTNIAFGGPDGKTCYVTLSDQGNIETFRADLPGRSWQMIQDSN
jgi:sugar lactone lactonase YvrE